MKQIFGYCKGTSKAIESVSDPVFAEKMLGDGVCIQPFGESGIISAPFDGKIMMVMDSKHAIGICDSEGVEFLIHIGIDTVKLGGTGFEVLTQVDAEVKKGDNLVCCDWTHIKSQGYDCSVMLINTDFSVSTIEKNIDIPVDSETVCGKY